MKRHYFGDFGSTAQPTVRRGSKGAAVTLLQNRLMEYGYPLPRYGADGDFGGETETAVRQFQADHGLSSDGVVGPLTWEKILGEPQAVQPSVQTTTSTSSTSLTDIINKVASAATKVGTSVTQSATKSAAKEIDKRIIYGSVAVALLLGGLIVAKKKGMI